MLLSGIVFASSFTDLWLTAGGFAAVPADFAAFGRDAASITSRLIIRPFGPVPRIPETSTPFLIRNLSRQGVIHARSPNSNPQARTPPHDPPPPQAPRLPESEQSSEPPPESFVTAGAASFTGAAVPAPSPSPHSPSHLRRHRLHILPRLLNTAIHAPTAILPPSPTTIFANQSPFQTLPTPAWPCPSPLPR